MVADSHEIGPTEVQPEFPPEVEGMDSLSVSVSRKGLLGNGNSRIGSKVLNILPARLRSLGLSSSDSLPSPTAKFKKFTEQRNELSRCVPSSRSQGFRERFSGILAQKVDWVSLQKICKQWIKSPLNMALLLWITVVAISGAILFLIMTGMLNHAIPKKSQRNAWFEVNNQILNALFTLMCLYQHPKRFHHLVLLLRWNPKDISSLRKVYCKNGTYKPNEWTHMMVVIVLLHVNCFAQYALCGLNLGYKRSERPAIGVAICLAFAIGAPAIAGVYSFVSPLGKEYDDEIDEESQRHVLDSGANTLTNRRKSMEVRFSFTSRNEHRTVEYAPEWSGGIFDIWEDISTAYLSLFCSFCVFGWNMDRLGFGNMYVHIATFLLFCSAPYWIFSLAAVNVDNENVREALVFTGVLLCIFGLLYGGFWRIQMRKRFNLPPNNFCFGNHDMADCAQWLCCCFCSLAQEVRTADFYDIADEKFCRKQTDENRLSMLSPLPREDGTPRFKSTSNSPLWHSPRQSRFATGNTLSPNQLSNDDYSKDRKLHNVDEEVSSSDDTFDLMKAPIPSSIQREDHYNR